MGSVKVIQYDERDTGGLFDPSFLFCRDTVVIDDEGIDPRSLDDIDQLLRRALFEQNGFMPFRPDRPVDVPRKIPHGEDHPIPRKLPLGQHQIPHNVARSDRRGAVGANQNV